MTDLKSVKPNTQRVSFTISVNSGSIRLARKYDSYLYPNIDLFGGLVSNNSVERGI